MSNYILKAKHKVTGTIHDFTALDHVHSYSYISEEYNMTFTSKEFKELYEVIEDPNHPYGGLEVEDNGGYLGTLGKTTTPLYLKPNSDIWDKPSQSYKEIIMQIKSGNDTWEDRFNKEFVDEDTGLLNISKYDHERLSP